MKQSKLDGFLKKQSRFVISTHTNDVPSKTDEFYNSYLDKSSSCCQQEKNRLRFKLAEMKTKIAQNQNAVNTCLKICEKKQTKIKKLEELLQSKKKDISAQPVVEANMKLFSKYDVQFPTEELAKLRSIGSTKKDDSTFILTGTRSLYRNDLNRAASITVSGRSRGPEPKQMMSPEKLETINGIFMERLDSLGLERGDRVERHKKLNELIRHALTNIKKTAHKVDDEIIQKINEKFDSQNSQETNE